MGKATDRASLKNYRRMETTSGTTISKIITNPAMLATRGPVPIPCLSGTNVAFSELDIASTNLEIKDLFGPE